MDPKKYPSNEFQIETLNVIAEVLDDLGVEVYEDERPNFYPQIIAKFTDLTVTNSRGDTAYVDDLYVIWRQSGSSSVELIPLIWRQTFGRQSASAGYRHSHLSANTSLEIASTLCIGGDSELRTLYSESTAALKEFNLNAFRTSLYFYLPSLIAALSWESLEGAPYKRIYTLFDIAYIKNNELTYEELLEIAHHFGIKVGESLKLYETSASIKALPELYPQVLTYAGKPVASAVFKRGTFDFREGVRSPFKINGEHLLTRFSEKDVDEFKLNLNCTTVRRSVNLQILESAIYNEIEHRKGECLSLAGFGQSFSETPINYKLITLKTDQRGS